MKMHLGHRGRHRSGRGRASLVAASVAGAALVPAVLLAGAGGAEAAICPSPPLKCYKVDITPSSFVAGSTQQLTATLTNESGGQSLGSSNLTAPSGYTVTSIGTPTRGTATLAGNTVQLRSLDLPVGQAVSVQLTVQAPAGTGSATWVSTAKQSNDYKGAGNDFVLDPTSGLTTTTTSGMSGCPSYDVSCGTNFIRYDQPSTVRTGTSVNATVWNIARMDFPATSVSGGQLYSLEAALSPGMCPVDGSQVQCAFEITAQDIPAPYDAAHPATLTVTCDSSHCSGAVLDQWLVFKRTAAGELVVIPSCTLGLLGGLCYTATVNGDGDSVITIEGITAGDPKFLGVPIGS